MTRGRASAYASAIQEILPDAIQVADRFHLHQNLLEESKNTVNSLVPVDIKIPKDYDKDCQKAEPQRNNESKKYHVVWITLLNKTKKVYSYTMPSMNMMMLDTVKRAIAKMVHCGKNTVTKYLNGDYESLCRKDFRSGMDQFYNHIISELSAGTSRKDVYRDLLTKGYQGGQTTAYDYMNKIIERLHIDVAVYKSTSAESVQKKKQLQGYDHLSKSGVFRFLWMNTEITAKHKAYLMDNYPQLNEMLACIREFRKIYQRKKYATALSFH